MNLKKITAVLCSIVTMMSMPVIANAQRAAVQTEKPKQTIQAGVTEQTSQTSETSTAATAGTQAEQSETESETTTQAPETTPAATTTTEEYYVPQPTTDAATVELKVGKVKNGKFVAKIKIKSDYPVANLSATVEYDSSLIKLVKADHNSDAGGMATDKNSSGKYVYNYINNYGSNYEGTYDTLNFELVDKSMVSTVLYLTVNSLDDTSLNPIGYTAENAIVKNNEVDSNGFSLNSNDYTKINIQMNGDPVSLESLGIKNVKDCTIENGEILIYENGNFKTLSTGSTKVMVTFKDGTTGYYIVTISQPDDSSQAVTTVVTTTNKSNDTPNNGISIKDILIRFVVAAGVIVVFVEYFVILKSKKKNKPQEEENNLEEENDLTDTDESAEENIDAEESSDSLDDDDFDDDELDIEHKKIDFDWSSIGLDDSTEKTDISETEESSESEDEKTDENNDNNDEE